MVMNKSSYNFLFPSVPLKINQIFMLLHNDAIRLSFRGVKLSSAWTIQLPEKLTRTPKSRFKNFILSSMGQFSVQAWGAFHTYAKHHEQKYKKHRKHVNTKHRYIIQLGRQQTKEFKEIIHNKSAVPKAASFYWS